MKNAIILTGIKHCGKSTQGKLLAERLGCSFFDTDDIIFDITGKTPRQIYNEQGAQAFMQAETNACEFLAQKNISDMVISTGGGICNNTDAVSILRKMGTIIFLEIPEKTAADRIVEEIKYADGKMTELPAYIAKENPETEEDVRKIFSVFYIKRCSLYKEIADISIQLENKSKEENAELIWQKISALK